MPPADPPTGTDAVVVIPVKAFSAAKGRLASALDHHERAALARRMAENVVAAAAPLGVVVCCDDPEVAAWARGVGADVVDTTGADLNGSVALGVAHLARAGVPRALVAHADLPHAHDLASVLRSADDDPTAVVAVPDRHGTGTNVLLIPTTVEFGLHYGPGSFAAHAAEAERRGLRWVVVTDPDLAWDVDEPDDLDRLTVPPDLAPDTEPGVTP